MLLHPNSGKLVQGKVDKDLRIDTLLPSSIERFPWAGHLGLRMLPQVVEEIDSAATTLVFTNTRSQSEIWYQAILGARPDWAGLIALHHGSLSREVRDWVEMGLKQGALKTVVCTSSLDLGVDFLPVERVLQIGSPKGVARLMQRVFQEHRYFETPFTVNNRPGGGGTIAPHLAQRRGHVGLRAVVLKLPGQTRIVRIDAHAQRRAPLPHPTHQPISKMPAQRPTPDRRVPRDSVAGPCRTRESAARSNTWGGTSSSIKPTSRA